MNWHNNKWCRLFFLNLKCLYVLLKATQTYLMVFNLLCNLPYSLFSLCAVVT